MRIFNLGSRDQIPPGEGRAFLAGGEAVAVFHTRAGAVYAMQAGCPHRGGPLADGLVDARRVVCPLHARSFALATGAPLDGTCEAVRTFRIELSASGDLLLHVGGDA